MTRSLGLVLALDHIHEIAADLGHGTIMGRYMNNVDINTYRLGSQFDVYTEYGGACLLGVNGNVIIAHGRSQAKAIKSAIGLAKETVERAITEIVKEGKHE